LVKFGKLSLKKAITSSAEGGFIPVGGSEGFCFFFKKSHKKSPIPFPNLL